MNVIRCKIVTSRRARCRITRTTDVGNGSMVNHGWNRKPFLFEELLRACVEPLEHSDKGTRNGSHVNACGSTHVLFCGDGEVCEEVGVTLPSGCARFRRGVLHANLNPV
jgi:hypothetical protein